MCALSSKNSNFKQKDCHITFVFNDYMFYVLDSPLDVHWIEILTIISITTILAEEFRHIKILYFLSMCCNKLLYLLVLLSRQLILENQNDVIEFLCYLSFITYIFSTRPLYQYFTESALVMYYCADC